MQRIRFGLALLLASFLSTGVVRADSPKVDLTVPIEKADASEFESLLERARAVQTSGEWQRDGWTDAEIERSIERLVESAKQASGLNHLPVGIKLAGLKPAAALGKRLQNTLHVSGNDAAATFADRCVLLVDGNVRISHASDCVIIASGAVKISHGGGNVIVAGHHLQISHDGASLPGRAESRGSVLVSGNVIRVSHAHGSICSAPGLVRISHANGVTFVNSPNTKVSRRSGCRDAAVAPLPLAPPTENNPLAEKLKITQVVDGDDDGPGPMAVAEINGVELVLRPGAAIKDGTGKPVEGLEGWTLSLVAEDFAMFRRGSDFASFAISPPAK